MNGASERVNIIGVGVSPLTMGEAVQTIDAWIQTDQRQYVCVSNVHTLMESYRHVQLRGVHNAAGMVTPDGMPLVWLSRLRGYPQTERVYGPDLLMAVCEASQDKGYKHFFYGGAPGIAEQLISNLRARFPALEVVGYDAPPFRPLTDEEKEATIAQINAAAPHIVWVGLGAPKQEYWMSTYRARLNAPVLIGVGAAFDFHAGNKPQAPLWMQRNGLEWTFRLMSEPRRLWRRYLINNPLFLMLAAAQLLGLKRF